MLQQISRISHTFLFMFGDKVEDAINSQLIPTWHCLPSIVQSVS